MAKYINIDALVAEIERRLSRISQNTNAYEEGRKRTYLAVLALINTLEVREVQEEPVCEDLEEIAWNHADKKCHLDIAVFTPDEVKKERGKMQFTWQDLYDAVVFGAEWKEKQMMVKAVDAHVCYAWSSLCFGGFDWSKTGLDIGDKCKLIIIKED